MNSPTDLFEGLFDEEIVPADNVTKYDYWQGMPEYNNIKQADPEITATFKFRNKEDFDDFKSKITEHLYDNKRVFDGMQQKHKKQAWYPLATKPSRYTYHQKGDLNPRFPVYIVSKNRWKDNRTASALEKMNVPYHVIIEEDQYNKYAEYIDKSKLLILPKKYQDEYDVFWDDDDPRVGPGAARNFAWDHSIENGHDWHWVMDDNIDKFDRYNNNLKIQCNNGSVFYIAEEFVLRYTNVAQAGLNYAIFCPAGDGRPPVKFNTRIYSCLLIRNDVPYRWRGRYNEDTDLSLRMLKDGWCTIQFNAFLAEKRATQTVKGGNSAEFYDDEGTKNKSQMLVDMHPDVTTLTKRWNRWHHQVNYKPFENNKPILRDDVNIKDKINEFGMLLVDNQKDTE